MCNFRLMPIVYGTIMNLKSFSGHSLSYSLWLFLKTGIAELVLLRTWLSRIYLATGFLSMDVVSFDLRFVDIWQKSHSIVAMPRYLFIHYNTFAYKCVCLLFCIFWGNQWKSVEDILFLSDRTRKVSPFDALIVYHGPVTYVRIDDECRKYQAQWKQDTKIHMITRPFVLEAWHLRLWYGALNNGG